MMTTTSNPGGELPSPVRVNNEGPKVLRAGFIPLVDASVLIAAAEFGFARKEGLTLDLVKDVSWANVRDRLAFRQFDIAHMLSPMPVASMLGLGSNPHRRSRRFRWGAAAMRSRCRRGSSTGCGMTRDCRKRQARSTMPAPWQKLWRQ